MTSKVKMSGLSEDLNFTTLEGAEAEETIQAHLRDSQDLSLVLSGVSLGLQSGSALEDSYSTLSLSGNTLTNTEIATRENETHVAAATIGASQGASFVSFANVSTGTYAFSVMAPDGLDGAKSMAKRFAIDVVDAENPTFMPVLHSRDGELVDFLEYSSTQDLELKGDTCGPPCCSNGPGGKGRNLRGECIAESTWQCIASGGGCLLCAASSTWLVGLGCAVLSCSTAVASCCSAETTPTCQSCGCGVT